MFAPCSAKVRATSSRSRGRSHASTAIWTRKLLRRAAVPAHRREALGVAAQRPDVRAVLPVDRDPLAERDVADDLVARHRRAALREPDEHVLDAFDVDPELGAPDCLRRARRLERDGVLFRDLCRLQALDDLVDDLTRRELPGAEREVEVLRLLEARPRGSPGRARPSRRSSGTAASAAFSACSSDSRPFCSVSSRVSRENHCRILFRAREDFASVIQSRDGPRPLFEVRISTKSPLFSG